ncbi:hypothetical protein [Nocardia arizonensis]|uniref:hypothetical protein n=1 Tax=Nocardia arizonensis TaxID=1141647 RepID=UPI0006D26455|nr:hypothetical protein [Nocardia arizonensis]
MGNPLDSDHAGVLSDSTFWQTATVSMPLTVTSQVVVFSLIAGVIDGIFPSLDLSRHWIYATIVAVTAMTGALLARHGTARTLGAATGVSAAGALVTFVWLATI